MIEPFVTSIADANDLHGEPDFPLAFTAALAADPTRRLFKRDPSNIFYRKIWEYCYILKQFHYWRQPAAKAYGFGCGLERLPLYLSTYCASVIATDAPPNVAKDCWKNSEQYLTGIEWYQRNIFREEFGPAIDKIQVDYHDMNHIDQSTEKQDFIWSASSLEHLGTMDASFEFIVQSSKLLTQRGIAVHCTEFNMSSDTETRLEGDSVYFRVQDILRLHKRLDQEGFIMSPANLTHWHHPYNSYVDVPPYNAHPSHMRLIFDGYILTSFGFCVRRK